MASFSLRSRRLLLSLAPLTALIGLLLLHQAGQQGIGQSGFGMAQSGVRTSLYFRRNSNMANPQITKGGAAVVIALNSIAANTANGAWQLLNGAAVVASGTYASLPNTNNGVTLSALTNAGSPPFANSATLQISAGSSVAAGAGLTLRVNGNGSGPDSSGSLDVLAAAPSLVVPTGLTATPAANLQVTIDSANKASQPSGATYSILRGTTSGAESATPYKTGITALPYTFTESAPGTYFYQLTAAAGGATSAASAEVSAAAYNSASAPSNTASGTPAVPAPGALTALAITLADSGTAPNPTVSWALPTTGTTYTGFNLRRGTAAAGESATPLNASPLAANALSFVDTAALYAADYYYVIDGLSSGGTVTSAELHIKTDTASPTNLAVVFGNGQAAASWTNATGTLGILLERTVQGANNWGPVQTVLSPITSYTDTTCINGTAYSYRVRDLD